MATSKTGALFSTFVNRPIVVIVKVVKYEVLYYNSYVFSNHKW